jgi:hypothetical protein
MGRKLFADHDSFDSDYLNDAYADDAETAAVVFEQYLNDLPENMRLLSQSFKDRNIEVFRKVIHKQKPGFSYVGLTDVTSKFDELQTLCNNSDDLVKYSSQIESVIQRINSSTAHLEALLISLKQPQHLG